MIAHVSGRLLEKHPTRVVVEVGGIGLEILVPLPASQSLGEVGSACALHTVLVVREDALTLYGFRNVEERGLFLKLIGVSGIGPKIALGALSGPPPEVLVAAIRDRDLAVLTRLPGIGKKTAERMALELKDGLTGFTAGSPAGARSPVSSDAVAALVSLGYSAASAEEAVARIQESAPSASVEDLVRSALTRLAGGKKR